MKLWQRHIFAEISKVFFFFLFCFFGLYVLLDYSMNASFFIQKGRFDVDAFFSLYRDHFLKRADLLLPLALLVATIKVLTSMNVRCEWMVLQVAGIRTRKLLAPFCIAALLCTLFNWVNFEFFLPNALNRIDDFHATRSQSSHRAQRRELIHIISLKDNSKLIYQNYDAEKNALFDVLWIRSPSDVWRMKFLSADPTVTKAEYVDHLVRGSNGFLEKKESHLAYTFSDLKWRQSWLGRATIPLEHRSMRELLQMKTATPYEIPRIRSQLCHKTVTPLLSLIAVVAVAPFCIAFSRSSPLFIIYAVGLFSLFAFHMLLDVGVVLGENGIFSPIATLCAPIALAGSIFTWRFLRQS